MTRQLSRHHRPTYYRRRGYTLVVFAMLFFCLMALGALVIDIGMARVTQRQMQTAVDSAALEGLRGDRVSASEFADFVFDADGDLDISTALDSKWQLFEDQRSNPSIDSRFIGIMEQFTYDPIQGTNLPHLRTNDDNAAGGDMVGFQRPDDFDPGITRPALLVQMRRTGEASTAEQSIGPRMPYLFARGSLMARDVVGTQVESGTGIAIRAEATADSRPALSIGRRPQDSPDILALNVPGALPFYVLQSQWAALVASTTPVTIADQVVLRGSGSQELGRVYDTDESDGGLGQSFTLAQRVPFATSGTLTGTTIQQAAAQRYDPATMTTVAYGYFPIAASFGTTSDLWVVGLGVAQITNAGSSAFDLTILTDFIAPANASSALSPVADSLFAANPTKHRT